MTPADPSIKLADEQRTRPGLAIIRRHLPLISLLAILWLTCFSGLSKFALIDLVDEGLYASISRQMLESGDWVTPRVGGQIFLEKPPLLFWAQALCARLLGPTILAARLPSALAVAATSLILWFWLKRRRQEVAGWLAAVLYALFPLAMVMGRLGMTDALLTLWLTIAMVGLAAGYQGKSKGYLLAAIGCALATLTKGPIGFLLPGATFVLWLILKRDLKPLLKPVWLLAFVLFAVVVLPWHLAAWQANGNYFLREYFWHQQVQRAMGLGFGHNRAFWFYVPVLICASFPFIAFVPRAWWRGLKEVTRREDLSDYKGLWALWTVLVLLFFSLSQSKLPSYILPVLPGLALLVGSHIDELFRDDGRLARLESLILGFAGSLIGLVLLSSGVLGLQWRSQPSPLPYSARLLSGTIGWQSGPMNEARSWFRLSPFIVLAPDFLILGLLFLLATALMLWWRRNLVRVFQTAAVFGLGLAVVFGGFTLPAWSRFDIEPLWQLSESTRPALEQGEPLVLYGIHPARTSVRFLLGHSDLITETVDPPTLRKVIAQYPRGRIITIDLNTLPPLNATVHQESKAGHWILWRFER